MNQWSFVIAAYLVVGAGAAGLALLTWCAMRRAEAAAAALRRR